MLETIYPRDRQPLTSIDDRLLDVIFTKRFPSRLCPTCGAVCYRTRTRKDYRCINGHTISPLAGLVFHKSATPLSQWFEVYYQVALDPAVSAKKLQRCLGVTYKTAWRMRKLAKQDLSSMLEY